MLGILFIVLLAAYLAFLHPIFKPKQKEENSQKYRTQINKLWKIAQESMRQRKPLRAEKALLAILKVDEKNAAAYNRLGILYAKEQKYDEAIECFEIAQSLDNNASSLHNVGLIYLETGAYEKAAIAFKQALEMEGDLPARYIALSKAQEKMGQRKDAIASLESAYELDHATSTLRQILALYEAAGDTAAIAATTARIEKRLSEDAKKRIKKRPLGSSGPRRAPLSRTPVPRTHPAKRPPLVRPKPSRTKTSASKKPQRKVI